MQWQGFAAIAAIAASTSTAEVRPTPYAAHVALMQNLR
jgi:hypothetical protein